MSYFESAEDTVISKKRAIVEIENHGCEPSDFFAEMGENDEYQAQVVLSWLGY